MVILGIDPGLATTGYALLTTNLGNAEKIQWGCITTSAGAPTAERLLQLRAELNKIIRARRPDRTALEKLFFYSNAKTAMAVGEARGVILTTLAEQGLPIFELTPLAVKRAVTGSGSADKQQIQKMLKLLFHLKEPPRPDDAADALAIAYCAAAFKHQ